MKYVRYVFFIILIVLFLIGLLAGQDLASAQDKATPTTASFPTLPPEWTPTQNATDTPRPIPTREPSPTIALTSTPTPFPTPLPAPPSARLTGLTLVWQQYNGCAPAALTMMLLYHGWDGTRAICNRALRPHSQDVSVRSSEMIAFAEEAGLRGIVRTGGTLEILRALITAGYPVLVENVDGPRGEWWGHNRVIMGYDNEASVVYTFDSLLGAGTRRDGRAIDYAEFDALWKPFNRTYLVLYPPEAEGRMQTLLGSQWNATLNAQWTLSQADRELAQNREDALAWFNLGEAHVVLGNFSEAAYAFDRAQEIGLPWRIMWYQHGPFEAYLQTGRYEDVIALGQQVLNTTPGVEEVYYYMGRAYAVLGDTERARSSLQQALNRNPSYVEAGIAMERLNNPQTTAGQ